MKAATAPPDEQLKTLPRHFKRFHSCIGSVLRVIRFDKVKTNKRGCDSRKILAQMETKWIMRLNTISPLGLNETLSFAPFLWFDMVFSPLFSDLFISIDVSMLSFWLHSIIRYLYLSSGWSHSITGFNGLLCLSSLFSSTMIPAFPYLMMWETRICRAISKTRLDTWMRNIKSLHVDESRT